jgi:hypothetical protein
MKRLKSTFNAFLLLLALYTPATQAEPDLHPTHVDVMDSCRQGIVVWKPFKTNLKCGIVGTPQVKVFDGAGRLRFIGSALDSIEWAKSGFPNTPIPENVTVRDAVSEARITHVSPPSSGHGWVTYYSSKPCPPCETQLTTFRSDVLPKLGTGTALNVFELGE